MKSRMGKFLRVILLLTFAITSLGFRSGSDNHREYDQQAEIVGHIEIELYGYFKSHSSGSDAIMEWHAASGILPIVLTDFDTAYYHKQPYRVVTTTLYSVFEGFWTVGIPRVGTVTRIHPISWDVSARVEPDCSVGFFIHENWFPGTMIGCAPIIGCTVEATEAETFIHSGSMTIPAGEGIGVIDWSNNGKLTLTIKDLLVREGYQCNFYLEE